MQHSMAGDLHLPAAVAAAAGPAALAALSLEQQQHQKQQQELASGGGSKAAAGCAVKGGSTQHTPRISPRISPRPSQHSGSGFVRPSLREQHGKGDPKGPVSPGKVNSPGVYARVPMPESEMPDSEIGAIRSPAMSWWPVKYDIGS